VFVQKSPSRHPLFRGPGLRFGCTSLKTVSVSFRSGGSIFQKIAQGTVTSKNGNHNAKVVYIVILYQWDIFASCSAVSNRWIKGLISGHPPLHSEAFNNHLLLGRWSETPPTRFVMRAESSYRQIATVLSRPKFASSSITFNLTNLPMSNPPSPSTMTRSLIPSWVN